MREGLLYLNTRFFGVFSHLWGRSRLVKRRPEFDGAALPENERKITTPVVDEFCKYL